MDPGKVKAILGWQVPRTWKQLQSFLGFTNIYRQFIPSFAKIALLITELLKTGRGEEKPQLSQPLNWTMECQGELNRLFAEEPVLKHTNPEEPFIIQVNASNMAVGSVLLQKNRKGKLQPCTYTSQKLTKIYRLWAASLRRRKQKLPSLTLGKGGRYLPGGNSSKGVKCLSR